MTRCGTLALSWGQSGGFYLLPRRVCLGRVALTYVPGVEIDDLMESYVSGKSVPTMYPEGSNHVRSERENT